MFGLSCGYLESYNQYKNFMRTFGKGMSPKEYGEYLASKNGNKNKNKRRRGRK